MNSSYSRYNTYPAGRPSGSRRLSESLSGNWVTMREGRGGNTSGGGRYNGTEDVRPPETPAADENCAYAANADAAAEYAAAERTDAATEAAGEKDIVAKDISAESWHKVSAVTSAGIGAYGCIYHKGTQRLTVSRPGEAVPVPFSAHSCLNRIGHNMGDAHAAIVDTGDYEIAFDVRVTANASAPVVFELRAGDEPIPGGTIVFALSSGIRECRGGTMTHLQAGDRISLVLTSVSVCEATLSATGVSAMLRLKKLN